MTIKTWRARIGVPEDFPLTCATSVERAMSEEIAELRKALDEISADAARYRWLRADASSLGGRFTIEYCDPKHGDANPVVGQVLIDSTIDKAMQ